MIITICTYNEIENLPRLITEIHAAYPETDILVVDDNSPDGTGQLADELAQADTRIHVLHRLNERGLGTATLKAFRYAIDADYELLLNLDADFSHPPRYIPEIIKALQLHGADVSIGSRYVRGGKIIGWPWRRHVMSRCINTWSRFWLGLKINDCSGSYRCYRCEMLGRIDFSSFRSHGYAMQEELLFRAARVGAKFVETPIVFEDRVVGESNLNWKEAIRAVFDIMRCGLERRVE